MKPATYPALVGVAAALVDGSKASKLNALFSPVDDWQELAAQAEIHGLSVMLGRLSNSGETQIPRELDLQLKALTIRHKKVLAARRVVLLDVINLFETHDINFAFLKGAALANLIYDPPWLRPMRDIDILVSKNDAHKAQKLLREIDFSNEDYTAGYLFEHHHLPNSTRIQNDFTISLEIHHDALSGDVDASITLDALAGELQSFSFDHKKAYAFGHEDMLKHLYYHTFEPDEVIKLGSMVDMVRYSSYFVDDIDWKTLEKKQANTVNALRCIHALIPLPDQLRERLIGKPEKPWKVANMGEGFTPLSKISRIPNKLDKLKALLLPSQWWTHIFYGIAPNKSLAYTRLVRHPVALSKWLFRRYSAAKMSSSL